jgi:hypothetical protein
MAYWNSQIWTLARLHQIPLIFTEDFNLGAVLEEVCFVNPIVVFDLISFLAVLMSLTILLTCWKHALSRDEKSTGC